MNESISIQAQRDLLELSFVKHYQEAAIRKMKAEAEFEENRARREHFEAAIVALKFETEQLVVEQNKDTLQRSKQLKRPCMNVGVVIRPETRMDGTIYIAQWGELEAEGDTPEQACSNFDRMWVGGADEL
jgi:hypothetical protein